MMDYKELKEQIVELNETIDKLGKEATSFEAKKAALDEAAKSLKVLADNMSNVVGNVETMLQKVEEVTVDKTLSAMQTSASDIKAGCSEYEKQTKNTLDQVIKTTEGVKSNCREYKEQAKNTLDQVVETSQDVKNSFRECENQTKNALDLIAKSSQDIANSNKALMNTTNALIESNNNAIEAISKKATMLGTIAIICSVVALAMTFLKK